VDPRNRQQIGVGGALVAKKRAEVSRLRGVERVMSQLC